MIVPFFGSRRAREAALGGLGLGLYIVREIVRPTGEALR